MKREDVAVLAEAGAPEEIVLRARSRQSEAQGDYAGAVTPPEAWALLQAGAARLVDVRTAAELSYVGRVPGALHAEWQGKDEDAIARFLARLRDQTEPGEMVLLLCRSAVRSHHAAVAATQAGWRAVFNVLEGFEGQRDHAQQRGHLDGWRHHGLPWLQD